MRHDEDLKRKVAPRTSARRNRRSRDSISWGQWPGTETTGSSVSTDYRAPSPRGLRASKFLAECRSDAELRTTIGLLEANSRNRWADLVTPQRPLRTRRHKSPALMLSSLPVDGRGPTPDAAAAAETSLLGSSAASGAWDLDQALELTSSIESLPVTPPAERLDPAACNLSAALLAPPKALLSNKAPAVSAQLQAIAASLQASGLRPEVVTACEDMSEHALSLAADIFAKRYRAYGHSV